jgi:phosphotransferase system HPr (HPr) family protein
MSCLVTTNRNPKRPGPARAAHSTSARKASLVVSNEFGLHMRAAAMLVQVAGSFDARLTIEFGKQRVSAKSIMSLLSLGVSKGMTIHAVAEGAEANEVIRALEILFAGGFYEKAVTKNKAQGGHRSEGPDHELTQDRTVIQEILEYVAASAQKPPP